MAYSEFTLSLELELQAVKEELDLAKKQIERYSHVVKTLSVKLDTLQNSICNTCKTKLVVSGSTSSLSSLQGNPALPQTSSHKQQFNRNAEASTKPFRSEPAFYESHPAQPQTKTLATPNAETPQRDKGRRQAGVISDVPNSTESSRFPSSIKQIETTFVPPIADIDEITKSPTATQPDEADWSVVYNNQVKQTLNIHLAHTLKMKSTVLRVKFSRGGEYLAVGLKSGETYIYNIETLSNRVLVEHPVEKKPRIWAVQFSLDDRYLAIGDSDGQIKIWDIAERRVLSVFKGHTSPVYSLDFSPDGQFLVSGSLDGSVRIWCMRDGTSRKLVDTDYMSSVFYSALSPDGRYVAAGNQDGMLRVWDFRSGRLLEKWKPKGPALTVYSVAFTSDGKGLLSGGFDNAMRLWDISLLTANPPPSRRGVGGGYMNNFIFRGHTGTVCSVSAFPDIRWVLSGSWDLSVCIWDARTGILQCTLNGHQQGVAATDVSLDGLHLASGSWDSLVRVWRYERSG